MAKKRWFRARGRVGHEPWWASLPREELLDLRLCELRVDVASTTMGERVRALGAELERAGLRFRPYVWFSTDWFTPDGFTGFAVPFYLAHPRLARLERSHMFDVEGGTHDSCLRLLRHEAGHALDHAYRLRRRRTFREVFGKVSVPYRESYAVDPDSRRFVLNLDQWYAQSHPVEDFAETFAVWLDPDSRWRLRYRGWPAYAKLEYVDELMHELADRAPLVRTRERADSIAGLRTTLRDHYRRKRAYYDVELPSIHDASLRRLFDVGASGREAAAAFLRRRRAALRRRVAAVTGVHPYVVDQLLNELIPRCRRLGLRLRGPARDVEVDMAVLLASLTTKLALGARPHYSR